MKPRNRKAQAHAARRQRKADKRRDARKAARQGRATVKAELRLHHRPQQARGLGRFVRGALHRANVLVLPERQRQKVA